MESRLSRQQRNPSTYSGTVKPVQVSHLNIFPRFTHW